LQLPKGTESIKDKMKKMRKYCVSGQPHPVTSYGWDSAQLWTNFIQRWGVGVIFMYSESANWQLHKTRSTHTQCGGGGGLYRDHAQQPAVKCPCTLLFGWRFAKRTLWNCLGAWKSIHVVVVTRTLLKWLFLIDQLQWLAEVMRVKESLTLYIHRFRLMGGDGGGETKQWTLDVVNILIERGCGWVCSNVHVQNNIQEISSHPQASHERLDNRQWWLIESCHLGPSLWMANQS